MAPFISRVIGPTSFVAAEIHQGFADGGVYGGRPQCTIQVACQLRPSKNRGEFKGIEHGAEAARRRHARETRATRLNISHDQ